MTGRNELRCTVTEDARVILDILKYSKNTYTATFIHFKFRVKRVTCYFMTYAILFFNTLFHIFGYDITQILLYNINIHVYIYYSVVYMHIHKYKVNIR